MSVETKVCFNRWDNPIATAEPYGFDHITVKINDVGQSTFVEATISLEMAQGLATQINRLVKTLKGVQP